MIEDWVELFIDLAEQLGWPAVITSTWRTRIQQEQLYHARGRSRLPAAPPGTSTHEYGLAFDVQAVNAEDQDKLGALGEALGLYWGGRFRRSDPVHFQLVSPTAWASLFPQA